MNKTPYGNTHQFSAERGHRGSLAVRTRSFSEFSDNIPKKPWTFICSYSSWVVSYLIKPLKSGQFLKISLKVILIQQLFVAAEASSLANASGLFELFPEHNPNQWSLFEQMELNWGGWLNAGVTYNTNQPNDRFNGTLGFSDRSDELQLNQFYHFLERHASGEPERWSIGGRLDFIFGSDAYYTRSMGDPGKHWDAHLVNQGIYGIAFPQAYLEIFAPVGRGLRVKVGEFYTLIGYESVMAPENFFYSHSYAMQFGEPFSHTGILASYAINDSLGLKVGAVTGSPYAGWDGTFVHKLENWGLIGSINWAFLETGTSVDFSGSHGYLSDTPSQDVNLFSTVVKQKIDDRWQLTVQHDYGWHGKSHENPGAEWYGFLTYLTYDLSKETILGLRLEWFRDDDGIRVGTPARHPTVPSQAANYYAVSLGANWKPWPWLNLRPSIRYDHSDGWQAFDNGAKSSQYIISSDVIVNF